MKAALCKTGQLVWSGLHTTHTGISFLVVWFWSEVCLGSVTQSLDQFVVFTFYILNTRTTATEYRTHVLKCDICFKCVLLCCCVF